MKKLTPLLYVFPFLLLISFKGVDILQSHSYITYEDNTTLSKVIGLHPLTGIQLPTTTPYPFRNRKVPYAILIRTPDISIANQSDIEGIMERLSIALHIKSPQSGEPDATAGDGLINLSEVEAFPAEGGEGIVLEGELNTSMEISAGTNIGYWAYILEGGNVTDRFYTVITAGVPEMTIHSSISSYDMMQDGMNLISVVAGKASLNFDSEYQTLTGSGPLNYENFKIETAQEECTISTKTKDGTWRVVEIKMPFSENPVINLPTSNGLAELPSLNEAVIFINPNIDESAKIRCAGSPITMPLPRLIHYFAAFYSLHGGEVDIIGPSGDTFRPANEMDEGREGLVMLDWQGGAGNILATKTYQRSGKREKATFEEDTRFQLRMNWGEEGFPLYCGLDNTDFWLPTDHGSYNCQSECGTGGCQLEVFVNEEWQPIHKSKEERDIVDQMAGQSLPEGATYPPSFPSWVRCNCY